MTSKPTLQKIIQGILNTEDENKQNYKRWERSNHRRRKYMQLESSIDLVEPSEILKQQKQLNWRNRHIHININTECQRIQLPNQKTLFGQVD
jgi:hypothetical protein